MQAIELGKVKLGDYIKRKRDSNTVFIRDGYNRKSQWDGPASYTCIDADDMGRCIFLKPSTIVFIDFDY